MELMRDCRAQVLRASSDCRATQASHIERVMKEDDMIKVLSMMKRKEGLSLDEFRHWLTQEHVKFARQIPGLLRFVVNIPETDSPDNPFDAVNELYFEDEAAMKHAFSSEAGQASGADALAHISARSRLITIEHRLID
jgi:uncharacterized protein (TIGR02118 family)